LAKKGEDIQKYKEDHKTKEFRNIKQQSRRKQLIHLEKNETSTDSTTYTIKT
jgi:hypothetical protein